MQYHLRESVRVRKDEEVLAFNGDGPTLASDKITSSPESPTVSKNKNEVDSSHDSTQNNATTEAITLKRNGLSASPLGQIPVETRLAIMQLSTQPIEKITIVPRAMTRDDYDAPVVGSEAPSLVFTSKNLFAKACRQVYEEHADALKTQLFSLRIPTLHLHVLNFDFSLVTLEILSNFTAVHRQFFNARAHSICIHLTITDAFTHLPDEGGRLRWLERKAAEEEGPKKWLEWRAAEDSADRKITIDYKIARERSVKSADDTESLRLFLLLFDPYSDGQGDMGDIMRPMVAFFKAFKAKRRFQR